MEIVISNNLCLSDVPRPLESEIKKALTLPNPVFQQAQKQGRYTGNLEPSLRFYKEARTGGLVLPRGYAKNLFSLCHSHGIRPVFEDRRRVLPDVDISFRGKLRPYQQEAVNAILGRDSGVLNSPVGSGKTIVCLAVIAARQQPTTVVVHSSLLLKQWRERAAQFLNIPEGEIGMVGAGHNTIGTRLTIGIKNSVLNCLDEITPRTGFLIVDECHRAGSSGYCDLIGAFDCRYLLGISGTPWRSDGLSRVLHFNLGPMVHKVGPQALVDDGHILNPEIVWRKTRFKTHLDPSSQYTQVVSQLVADKERNRQIVADVLNTIREGQQTALLLSERKRHCETLHKMLGQDSVVVTGDTSTKEREKALEDVRKGKAKALISTNSLIGEGFDMARLSNMFLCSPIKWKGRTIQLTGRILRPQQGKQARLFDYVDSDVGVLKAQAKARLNTYKGQGWTWN